MLNEPQNLDDTPVVRLHTPVQSEFNRRWVVELCDGAAVECVLYRGDTLCVSSQVGCAVRCPFCASGRTGLSRPLALAELVGQVRAVQALGHPLQRVTVSGVGEPLHNAEAVQPFLGFCRSERLAMSLTTSGGPLPRLRRWLHEPHNGLTLSIHAGSEALRARMLPYAPGLAGVFATLAEELPRMTRRRRKKTALAYLVVEGRNDSDEEIDAFIERAAPLGLQVHLYAYNPIDSSDTGRIPRARYEAIHARIANAGLGVRMSSQARIEPNGGCGTLVASHSLRGAARNGGRRPPRAL